MLPFQSASGGDEGKGGVEQQRQPHHLFFHPSKGISVSEMTGMFFFPPKITPNIFFPPISAHSHELPRLQGGQYGFSASDVLPHTKATRNKAARPLHVHSPAVPGICTESRQRLHTVRHNAVGQWAYMTSEDGGFGCQAKGQSVLDGLLRPPRCHPPGNDLQ